LKIVVYVILNKLTVSVIFFLSRDLSSDKLLPGSLTTCLG